MLKINKIKKTINESVKNVSRLLFGLGLVSTIGFASSCKLKKIELKLGILEGKIVGAQSPSLSPPSSFMPQTNEISGAKVCLIDGTKNIDAPCVKQTYTDQQGKYIIQTIPNKYHRCIDVNNDENYDECDTVAVKADKVTSEGKKEIECKQKKKFNCFVGLDKQNYCPGEIMEIFVNCGGESGYSYSLSGKFVNEKENKVYDIIYIGDGDGNFSEVISYPLPLTWPPTNTPPGSDWKFYLYSDSQAYGEVLEDKDNFNILDKVCDVPPGEIGLEVIVEGGKELINYTNDVNATFIPSEDVNELAYCTAAEQTCEPTSYSTYKENVVVVLPGQSGLKNVCGKVKKSDKISNTACDSIFVDLLLPSITFTNVQQTNLDNGQSLNDIFAEACISDNTGIKKVVGKIYRGDNLVKEEELSFTEDQSCAKPGEIGYKTNITANDVVGGNYKIEIGAVDLASNTNKNDTYGYVDLIPPSITITSPDHLLANYVCFGDQTKNEEQCSNVDASEYRYDPSYPEFYTNQIGLDGRLYDGFLDLVLSGQDESGIMAYEIDWGDGNIQTTTQTIVAHPYTNSGYYTIKVRAKDNKENWSDYVTLKAKITIHKKDVDWAFWNFVHSQVPGVASMIFYCDDCEAASQNGKADYCYITDESYRTLSVYNAIYSLNCYQPAQWVGHRFVSLDRLVSNETPLEDLRLSNNEIVAANSQANSTPPWGVAIVPITYPEIISTENCPNYPNDLRNNNYRSLYCWYKFGDDRGDY